MPYLEDNLLKTVPIEVLETPIIGKSELIAQVNTVPSWMDPFISYLHDGVLTNDRDQARSLCWKNRHSGMADFFIKKNVLNIKTTRSKIQVAKNNKINADQYLL